MARDDDHQWRLAKTVPVQGDRTDAAAQAWELATTYVPAELHLPAGASASRKVFRASDGSWLVEAWSTLKRMHVRIATAEQVHVQQYARG
ncbi:hypothetical protein [Streptomyces sp. NPDC055060]